LECILIKADDEYLQVYGNDLELGIESAHIEATIEEPGGVAVEAKILLDILRKMPAGMIIISADEQNISKIMSGKTEFRVVGQPADEYPLPEKLDKVDGFEIKAADFKDMIRQTIFSVSTDISRAILTGELLEIKDGAIHLVSIDGFRISYRHSEDSGLDPEMKKSAVVPAKTLNELAKILPSSGDTKISFYIKESYILFQTESHTLISRLLTGDFINYSQIFSEDYNTRMTTERMLLVMAMERASLLARESKNTPVKMSIGSETVVITSNTEMGTSFEELTAQIDGPPLDIAFNPKYMIEALKAVNDDKVILTFTTALSPCIIKGENSMVCKYLILPLRIRD